MDGFYCGSVLTLPREYSIMNGMKSCFISRKRVSRTIISLMIALLLVLFAFCMVSCGKEATSTGPYAAVSDDFRTDYYVGEALDVQGTLKMYSDARTYTEIPITEEMVSGFDTSTAGTFIAKVTYGEFVASVAVTVHPAKANSITLDAETIPTVIYQNKPFPSTVTMSVVLSNGETLDRVPVTAKMLGGFNSKVAGEHNITVTYLSATTSFVVLIKEDVRVGIELVGAKSEYAVNEPLLIDGVIIRVLMESGDFSETSLSQGVVNGFSTSLGGDHVATVEYKGFQCEYRYFVAKRPSRLTLVEGTLPDLYEKGDVLPSTGKAVLTYDDGTAETISLGGEEIPSFSTADAGDKVVNVTVAGVSTDYRYSVLPSIFSVTVYGYTSAVRQNTRFDGLGELIVAYEDAEDGSEQRESIPLSSPDAVRVTEEDSAGKVIQRITTDRLEVVYTTSEMGDVLQYVTFRTRTVDFTVHVYSEEESETAVDSISIAGIFPSIVLGDEVNVSGVEVTINYRYKTPATVKCEASWVNVDFPDEIEGDYVDLPVEISCFGVTAEESRTLRVLSPAYAARVTSLSVYGMKRLFLVGAEAPADGVTLRVVYGGGYRVEEVFPDLGEFDSSTEGEKVLTISYGDASVDVAYRVISEEEAATVTAIEISDFDPILFVGDTIEAIDRSAYDLTLIYGYGISRAPLSLSSDEMSLIGGPFTEAGTAEIILRYGADVDLARNVTVYPLEDKTRLTSIGVLDSTIDSIVGTAPDFSAYYLTLNYGYGTRIDRIPLSSEGVEITPYSIATEGLQSIRITYQSLECSAQLYFRAGMSDNVLQGLEFAGEPRNEFVVGDELSDVKVIAVYNVRRVLIDVTPEMIPDFSTETAGEYSVDITYGSLTIRYHYSVVAPPPQEPTEDQEEG